MYLNVKDTSKEVKGKDDPVKLYKYSIPEKEEDTEHKI